MVVQPNQLSVRILHTYIWESWPTLLTSIFFLSAAMQFNKSSRYTKRKKQMAVHQDKKKLLSLRVRSC